MTVKPTAPLRVLAESVWRIPERIGRAVPLSETHSRRRPPRRAATAREMKELIDAYEIDVHCSVCMTTAQKSIAWIRVHHLMNCSNCDRIITLRTAPMMVEIRSVIRLMPELQSQLLETVGRITSIMRR